MTYAYKALDKENEEVLMKEMMIGVSEIFIFEILNVLLYELDYLMNYK